MRYRFLSFFILSIVLHLLLFILVSRVKNISFLENPIQENVVFMQLIPIDRINNLNQQEKAINNSIIEENAKNIENIIQQYTKDTSNILDNTENKLQKEIIHDKNFDQTQEAISVNTSSIKSKIIEKKLNKLPNNAQTIIKKSAQKNQAKQNNLDLKDLEQTLLKNIEDQNKEKSSQGKLKNSAKKSSNTSKNQVTNKSDKFDSNLDESITVQLLLQKRIESNWSKPPSMRDYEKLKIKVKVRLNINQLVEEISDFIFYNETVPQNIQNVIKESIIRAIKLSEPFDMLSLDNYDYWHSNSFIFSYK